MAGKPSYEELEQRVQELEKEAARGAQVEEPAARQNTVLAGIARIFHEALTCRTEEELGRVCLAVAEEVTQSKCAFIGEINPQTGKLDDIAISDAGWELCRMGDQSNQEKRNPTGLAIRGLYGRVLLDGKGLFTNDPSSHPDSIGTPTGHPPLTAFLGAPLIHDDRTIGVVALANREGGYGPEELEAVEALAPAIVQAFLSKRAEEALRESEERLRLAVDGGMLGTWNWDLITNETVWNRRLYRLVGRNPEVPVVSGGTFFKYIHPDDVGRVRRKVDEALQTGSKFLNEFRVVRQDGEVRWLAGSGRVYRDAEGRPVRIAGITYNITDRKLMEEELRRSRDELEIRVLERTADLQKKTGELEGLNARLQNLNERIEQEHSRRKYLSKRLVEILEKERREIALALHDEAGQTLASLKIDLELMESDKHLHKRTELLNSAKSKVSDLFAFVKNISRQLRPSVLDTLGFLSAVRFLIDQIKADRAGFDIEFFTSDPPERLDYDKETALYRIIQEALTNCLKYAQAKKVYINYVERDEAVVLTIEDDGQGFDYDEVSRRSAQEKTALGITIMRERAVQQGGTFWIDTAPGKGTFITVELPV